MYSEKKDKSIKNLFHLWQKEKQYLTMQQDMKHEKRQIKNKYKQQKKKLTTTKFLMFFLFISCSIVQLFTIYITIKIINIGFEIDLTPLTMLITSVVAEVIGFAIYSLKSTKENTKGGIVYETALLQKLRQQQEQNLKLDEEEKQQNSKQEVQG